MKRYPKLRTSRPLLVSLTILVVLALAVGRHHAATRQAAGPPDQLPSLSGLVELTPGEIQELKAGQPVSRLLPSDAEHEVAVAGALWMNAPVKAYVEALKNIEKMEHGGGFLVTKRISDPPRLEDFAALQLTDYDIEQLRKCHIGDCGIKLDEASIQHIQTDVDWSKPTASDQVNAVMRRMALDFVTAYRAGGNKQLPVYANKKEPVNVAKEFDTIIGEMQPLWRVQPDLRRYLLDFPQAKLPNSTSFFYWQMVDFGIRPVFRINHVVITETAGHTFVASKLLYATHYFWTALEVRELVPNPARQGFLFVDVSRGRSGSSGFKIKPARDKIRKATVKGLVDGMEATKSFLEGNTRTR